MGWYQESVINVTQNSSSVTGVATRWVSNAREGEALIGPDGRIYEIAAIASDKAMTISPAYKGATAAGQAYAIVPVEGYVKRLADQAARVLNSITLDLSEKVDVSELPQAVRDTVLDGIAFNVATAVLGSDTVLQALGKLQAQASNKVDKVAGKVLSSNDFTNTERVKLANIAEQSTKNASDADLRDRATHTGTQAISTVNGLQSALDGKETPAGALAQMNAFGLGGAGTGVSVENLDDYSIPTGFYRVNAATAGAHPVATAASAQLLTLRWNATNMSQLYVGLGAGQLFTRGYTTNGLWQPWRHIALSSYDATTASSANAFMDANGNLQRSTSSAKYKTQVELVDDVLMQAVIDGAEPVWYRSLCEADPADHSYWGLIAESLAEIDPRFVHWARPNKTVERTELVEVGRDENDQPICETEIHTEQVPDTDAPLQAEGVMYERLVVPLLWHAKKTQARVEALEQRLAAREAANG